MFQQLLRLSVCLSVCAQTRVQTYCCGLRAEERGEIVRASDRWSITSTVFGREQGTGNSEQGTGNSTWVADHFRRSERIQEGFRSQKKVQTVALEIAAIVSQRQSAVCAL